MAEGEVKQALSQAVVNSGKVLDILSVNNSTLF